MSIYSMSIDHLLKLAMKSSPVNAYYDPNAGPCQFSLDKAP